MKNLSRFILLTAAILALSAWANAQTISPAKKAVIAELIAITKTEEQMFQSTDTMMAAMEESFPLILRSSLEKMTDLSVKERDAMENALIAKHQSLSKKMRERFAQKINFKQFIEETYYPLYDKFFTEDEIRDMVNFYKTATGQKVINTLPDLFTEATRLSVDKLTPQVIKIVDEVLKEEMDSLKPPAPEKKKN